MLVGYSNACLVGCVRPRVLLPCSSSLSSDAVGSLPLVYVARTRLFFSRKLLPGIVNNGCERNRRPSFSFGVCVDAYNSSVFACLLLHAAGEVLVGDATSPFAYLVSAVLFFPWFDERSIGKGFTQPTFSTTSSPTSQAHLYPVSFLCDDTLDWRHFVLSFNVRAPTRCPFVPGSSLWREKLP